MGVEPGFDYGQTQALVVIVLLVLFFIFFLIRNRGLVQRIVVFFVVLVGVIAGLIEIAHEFGIHIGTHD